MQGSSTADGAETLIYLAASPDVEQTTGKYFQDKQETPSSPVTHEVDLRKKLWKVSEELTGLAR